MPYADRTTLNNLTPNLDIGDVADPALRLAFFQYITNLMDANYAEMQALVTSGTLSPLPPDDVRKKLFINGGFDIWQDGTFFSRDPILAFYTADCWAINVNANGGTLPGAISHTQEVLTSANDVPGAIFYYRFQTNGAGSGFGPDAEYSLRQNIENGTRYLCGGGVGQKIAVSLWARSSIPGKKLGVRMFQFYGTGGSVSPPDTLDGTHWTLTSEWTQYTFVFTVADTTFKSFGSNSDDALGFDIFTMWGSDVASQVGDTVAESFVGSGSIDLALVQGNAGSTLFPYQPRRFSEELALCQFFYEKSYDYDIAPGTSNLNGIETKVLPSNTIASFQPYGKVDFKIPKRAVPTVTIYPYTTPSNTGRVSGNNGTDLGANSGTPGYTGKTGFNVFNNSGGSLTTGDNAVIFHWTADARR